MNLKKEPEILALAILLFLLAFVVPGDLNIVRASFTTHTSPLTVELPAIRTPQPPPPPAAWSPGAELI